MPLKVSQTMSMFDKRKDSESVNDNSSSPPPRAASGRTQEAVSTARGVATIGSTITVNGEITGDESLVIDGTVNGTVTMQRNDLTVGQSGHVSAEISANVVRIEGEVTGDIAGTEKVVVTRSGRLQGNIVAPRVTLEDGSKFKGSIDMDPGPAQQPASTQTLRSVPTGTATPQPGHQGVGKP